MKDPFGQAIYDYFLNGKANDLVVNSNYTDDERIPVSYLFREFEDMPLIEKTALAQCQGTILDVGAGAGCHSMELQKIGLHVTALEKSALSCEVMQKRGIKSVVNADILEYSSAKFNTILMLMNGFGIAGTTNGLKKLLFHLKNLLQPNGFILADSSDISYLFQEEDGSEWIDLANDRYPGEMEYTVSYKHISASPFKWLFVDFNKLKKIASETGYICEKVTDGSHFDYLAKLYLK